MFDFYIDVFDYYTNVLNVVLNGERYTIENATYEGIARCEYDVETEDFIIETRIMLNKENIPEEVLMYLEEFECKLNGD